MDSPSPKGTRLAAMLLLAAFLVVSCAWPVAAGPFFSAGTPGSYSPASWADVSRHVTYSGRGILILRPLPRPAPQPAPSPAPAPSPLQPAPAPSPGAGGVLTADEQRMVDLINMERSRVGLPALQVNPVLVKLARLKSEDMVAKGYFGHMSPTYGSPFAMMDRAGVKYRYAGENLAGAPTVEMAHRALMNSPGHRANILSPHFTHVGIGIARGGPYGYMYTQMFTGQ
ncbi:MAG: CAP domain-containing protein [Bacillota bacterium]|nr:CAP domain-containing protein [Bacillota bacterium]